MKITGTIYAGKSASEKFDAKGEYIVIWPRNPNSFKTAPVTD